MNHRYGRAFRHSRHRRAVAVPHPCPSWCKVDHGAEVDEDGIRMHAQDSLARVAIWATENFETGEWSQEVTVSGCKFADREQVRALVLELLEVADLLEDGAQ